jgi:hypothetical protein
MANTTIQLRKSADEQVFIYSNLLTDLREIEIPDENGTLATREWVNENSIPLSGTTEGNPVTGVFEAEFDSGAGFKYEDDDVDFGFVIFDNPYVYYKDKTEDWLTDWRVFSNQIMISSENPNFVGLVGLNDYSDIEPESKNIYAQRQYVDNVAETKEDKTQSFELTSPYVLTNTTALQSFMGHIFNVVAGKYRFKVRFRGSSFASSGNKIITYCANDSYGKENCTAITV